MAQIYALPGTESGPAREPAEGSIEGEMPVLIPPGKYQMRCTGWETRMLYGRQPKVVLRLEVCDFGPYFGLKLARWYNAHKLKEPPRRKGKFVAGWSSDLVREYAGIIDEPNRNDRIALSRLRDILLVGHVVTVTRDRCQRRLPAAVQYSVVNYLEKAIV